MGQDNKKHARHGKNMWNAATQEETNAALTSLMGNHGYVFVHILPEFPSTDMMIGIDVNQLILNPIVIAAAKIDPRGMRSKHLMHQASF